MNTKYLRETKKRIPSKPELKEIAYSKLEKTILNMDSRLSNKDIKKLMFKLMLEL